MKKILLSFLMPIASVPLWAYDFEVDGIYYNITDETAKSVEVINGKNTGSIIISEKVVNNGTTYSVTSIGEEAFFGDDLTSVTIPNSVTTIGVNAFSNCLSLTSITIPNSVTTIGDGAFFYCPGLTSVTIGNSVTTIGNFAFAYCDGLTSATIGNSVTRIGNEAFESCAKLSSITIPNSVTTIGDRAFAYCDGLTSVTIPNSVTTIGVNAFRNCLSLTSITIPNSVTSIETGTFMGCTKLTSVTIPNSVTTIGESAFYKCNSLASVTIPNSVTTIGERAFFNCNSLTSVTIPNSVTSIATETFAYCTGLTSVIIPNSVTIIGGYAFYNCTGLTSVTIPCSATTIGESAFYNCTGLTSAIIGKSVKSIGNNAFYNCDALKTVTNCSGLKITTGSSAYGYVGYYASKIIKYDFVDKFGLCYSDAEHTKLVKYVGTDSQVTIPNSVTTIGDNSFRDCTDLISVTIPNSVTTIGKSAFYNCGNLTTIIIPSSVTSIAQYAFLNCHSLWIVANLSRLNITSGSSSYGYVGYYANKVITCGFIDEIGLCYSDAKKIKLVGYVGNDSHITIPNSVTAIGDIVFSSCHELESITIPNSVSSIGVSAFFNCSGLISVTIPNSVTTIGEKAFWACSGLTSATIGNSVTTIGNNAFESCAKLSSITIPNSVTTIGNKAFYNCHGLISVTIPNSVSSIGDSAFRGLGMNFKNLNKIIFLGNTPPEGIATAFSANSDRVTYVANDRYDGYSSVLGEIVKLSTLSSLFVVDGISYVPDNTAGVRSAIPIDYDYKTEILTIPNEVNYRTITLPVTKLGAYLLYGAKNGSLTICGDITEIEKMALPSSSNFSVRFADSDKDITMITPIQSLDSLYIGRNIVCSNGIVEIAKDGVLNYLEIDGPITGLSPNDYKNINRTALNKLVLGKNITSIGDNIFANCNYLKTVNLNADNIIIGNNVFENCAKLESLTIKPSAVSIGNYAFSGCVLLNNNLLFENSLESIGDYAFNECSSLKSLTVNADNCIIGKNAFASSKVTSINLNGSNQCNLGNYAFKSCTALTEVTVAGNSNYLNNIGDGAFEGCTSLGSVDLADTENCTIGKSAFKDCSQLESIAIPSGLKVLADSTFYDCASLYTFTLPEALTTIGSYVFYNVGQDLSLTLPKDLKSLSNYSFYNSKFTQIAFNNDNKVTLIPESCFANCPNLTEFVITQEISNIAKSAFASSHINSLKFVGNKSLILVDKTALSGTTIYDLYIGRKIKSDKMLFSSNRTLKTLEVGEYKVAIDKEEFKDCTALTTVKTSPTTTSIGGSAFNGCTRLNEVLLEENIVLVGQYAFANSGIKYINYPRSWTTIEPYTFYNCINLAEAILPATVTAIRSYAYANSGVTNVSIPTSVSLIDSYAFNNCNSLATLTLNEGVEKVSDYAFASTAITDLTIPSSMIEISKGAFKGCKSLKSLNIVDGSKEMIIANDGSNNPMFMNSPIENVYIGRIMKYDESVAAGYSPFYNNKSIRTVEFGDVPTRVYDNEFYLCSSLESAIIGDGVTFFGENSFSGCTSLKDFTFGVNVTMLGKESFSDCSGITQLRSYALNPPTCDDQAIVDINTFECELFVPTQSLEKYQTAEQWCDFWFMNSFDADLFVSYIEFDQSTVLLEKGNTQMLNPTVYPAEAITKTLRWYSSNTDIATVNNDGVITAVEGGETDIYAYSTDGTEIAACCHVTVFDPNAPVPYKFSIGNVELADTETTNIPVLMANEGEITAFMCDIRISDGLSIVVDDEDYAEFTLSDRAKRSHILTSNKIAENTYRIVAYSGSLATFDGNSGELFYIPVYKNEVSENYSIEITNIIATSPESVDNEIPSVSYDFNNVPTVNKGDVNLDGKITTGDVTSIVTYILLETPAVFNFDAADVNSDGSITTGDVTSVVTMILNNVSVNTTSTAKTVVVNSDFARDVFVVENTVVSGNRANVSIAMNGATGYVATQFDVIVPQGMKLIDVAGCDANAYSHEFVFNEYDENVSRIIIYSVNNETFTGLEQFDLVFEGENLNDNLTICNAIVTAIEGNQIKDYEAKSISFNAGLSAMESIHGASLKVWTEGNTLYIKGEKGIEVMITNTLGVSRSIVLGDDVYSETLADGIYLVNNKKVILK